MATEILTGISIFKTLFDTAKGLKDLNDITVRNAAVVELQEKILAAQAQQSALIERVGDLEKEVAGFKAWDAEKQRYMLTDFGSGTFAYALKKGMESGEPYHRLCATCYSAGHKGLLHSRGHDAFKRELVTCGACKSEFALGAKQPLPISRGSPPSEYF